MKYFLLLAFILSFNHPSHAQLVAMDFTQTDCEGVSHHLFSELDSGNVVIMEFIMTCNSCVAGGHALEAMIADLQNVYPGKIRLYQIAYTNSYTCSTMVNFKTTNGFNSSVFDQGANMVAYYGGFGMPTVAIVAGLSHTILYTNVGFVPSDTTDAGTSIRDFMFHVGVNELSSSVQSLAAYPNPANNLLSVELNINSGMNETVNMDVTDLSGRTVATIFRNKNISGEFKAEIDVTNIASGTYFLKSMFCEKLNYTKIRIVH